MDLRLQSQENANLPIRLTGIDRISSGIEKSETKKLRIEFRSVFASFAAGLVRTIAEAGMIAWSGGGLLAVAYLDGASR